MLTSLSIIVPAYNEEANLSHTVLTANSLLQDCVQEPLEWILVDDGSTDKTGIESETLAKSLAHATPLKHITRRGLGAAIWTGTSHASSEWCTWMPADGQIDPQAIVNMTKLAYQADLVILMREENKRTVQRQILTMAMYSLMRVVLGFDPYGYSGVFLVRRQIVQVIPLKGVTAVQNYAVVLHCQQNGYRIQQTQTVIQPRLSGKSKVANLSSTLQVFYEIFKLRFTH